MRNRAVFPHASCARRRNGARSTPRHGPLGLYRKRLINERGADVRLVKNFLPAPGERFIIFGPRRERGIAQGCRCTLFRHARGSFRASPSPTVAKSARLRLSVCLGVVWVVGMRSAFGRTASRCRQSICLFLACAIDHKWYICRLQMYEIDKVAQCLKGLASSSFK